MERLKQLRAEKGLSQARLAARAELDPSTVNQIERGAREASSATLRKLADALEVSLYELMEEEAPKGSGRPSETRRPPVLLEGTLGGKGGFSGELLVGIDAVFEDLIRALKPEEQDRTKIESAKKKVHELFSQSAS